MRQTIAVEWCVTIVNGVTVVIFLKWAIAAILLKDPILSPGKTSTYARIPRLHLLLLSSHSSHSPNQPFTTQEWKFALPRP